MSVQFGMKRIGWESDETKYKHSHCEGFTTLKSVGMGELGYRLFFYKYSNTLNKIYKL